MKNTSVRNQRSSVKTRAIPVFPHNRDFRADAFFIRSEITVGARSAQWPPIDSSRRAKIFRSATILQKARLSPRPHAAGNQSPAARLRLVRKTSADS
jgi:hypothetical protein